MRIPYIQFYPGDWLQDAALSKCSHSTRGLWIDALCRMHDNGRSGVLRGTREELARSLRCDPCELDTALRQLQSSGAADIAESCGLVTITNRRMKRESKQRHQSRLRMCKLRNKDPVTPPLLESDNRSSVSLSLSAAAPTDLSAPDRNLGWPDLKTVLAWAEMSGCPPDQAEKFWNHFEASGWIDKNGHPIVNARAKLAVWRDDHRAAASERQHHASEPRAASGTASLIHKQERLKRVEDAIVRLRNNKPDPATTEWAAQVKALKTQRSQLRQELGFPDV